MFSHESIHGELGFRLTGVKAKHAIVTFKIEKAVHEFGAVPRYVNGG